VRLSNSPGPQQALPASRRRVQGQFLVAAPSFENKSSFVVNLRPYRSQQNLRCSKSKAIFQN
jgi:hypothetical protein